MSYRRSGGNNMGGGNRGNQGGNRLFNNQPFQNNVNPWQGGGGMNQGGGGFLNQLTSNPQQLALALSTLLQPQVQNPPSLMNMNNSGMNRGNFDRFNNRGRDNNRRVEPYNKNRGGNWGNRDNNRNRNQGGGNRNKRDSKDDKKKDEKETKKDIKKEKDADHSMDEEEKKRDWKDEKKPADDEEGSETKDDEEGEGRNKDGRFFKIPSQFLTCFVCNKQMWDGESMEKHLKGRAHTEMMKALEESIGITVDILRENMRLTEERNIIELFRIQRTKKYSKFHGSEEHCNMCDLRFRGKMSSHRRSEGHQRLKRYLHPRCSICSKEFHSRIEWVEHRLTPEHLRKHCEKLEEDSTHPLDGAKVVSDEDDNVEVDLDKLLLEPLQTDNANPITELDEPLDNLPSRYPAYKNDRPLATKALVEFTGFVCELCNRTFTEETLAKKHLTTMRHYYKFIEAMKQKWDEKEKNEKEEREEAEKKETDETEEKVKSENGDAEGDEEGEQEDQEMDETLNDSAMETADETLNSSQDETMEDSQVSQEDEEEEPEAELEAEEVPVEKVEEKKPSPKKAKPGPASKKAAAAQVSKPGPASSKTTPTATRGRKARK